MNKKNIGVAVLDTGIYRHIDFDNRIIAFKDFITIRTFPMMIVVTEHMFPV